MRAGVEMSAVQREAVEMLVRRCRGRSPRRTIERLVKEGLCGEQECRAYVARARVEERVRLGEPKVEAMEVVASQMGCSYSTVRNYIYKRTK